MQLFLDSAMVDEIRHALNVWDIDGLTTNPRHVQSSGKPFRKVIGEIAELLDGTNKPVSVEVDPHLTQCGEIVEAGLELSRISPLFVIKVGASEQGFAAIRELSRQGIRTNATLIFSTTQAWLAARAGASYISPFLGWKEAHGDDVSTFVAEIRKMLDQFGYPSQIIAAAIRNGRQIATSALAGAHCVTASAVVISESFQNPYTNKGEEIFRQAWGETPR